MNENDFDWNKYLGYLVKSTTICKCGHCGNKADGEVVASYDNIRSYSDNILSWEAGLIWELVRCPNCDGINLRLVDFHTGAEPEIGRRAAKILYPSVIESPPGVPSEIDKAYQAALKVRHVDANAFAVSLRRVVEAVCKDREAKGKNLINKLQDLVRKGDLSERLSDIVHGIRKLGNVGAYYDNDLTPAEASLLNDLCKALLEYVYTAPELIEQGRLSLKRIENAEKN